MTSIVVVNERGRSTIFVAYPWAPYDRDEYKMKYRALEAKHDVTFEFAEDRLTTDQLMSKIEGMMSRADFCVFDFTGFNPNVALEYGMARGLRLEAYVAFNPASGERDVPSDVRGIDSLRYTDLDDLGARLDAFLAQSLVPAERERRAQARPGATPDRERYDEELAREPKTELQAKIETRGYWVSRIYPQRYVPGRIEYRNLPGTIGDAKVEGGRGGFTFPHTDTFNQFPQLGADWYGREFDLGYFIEHWRLFQSGQFIGIRALAEDWPEHLTNGQEFLPTGTGVGVVGAARHIGEAFDFAAGLAGSIPGTDPFVISISAMPLKRRILMGAATLQDPFLDRYLAGRRTEMAEFRFERTLARDEVLRLVAQPGGAMEARKLWRPIAVEAIRAF